MCPGYWFRYGYEWIIFCSNSRQGSGKCGGRFENEVLNNLCHDENVSQTTMTSTCVNTTKQLNHLNMTRTCTSTYIFKLIFASITLLLWLSLLKDIARFRYCLHSLRILGYLNNMLIYIYIYIYIYFPYVAILSHEFTWHRNENNSQLCVQTQS